MFYYLIVAVRYVQVDIYDDGPVGVPYSSLTVGVPLEVFPNERRVALTPQNTALLLKKGFSRILVEKSAGLHAQFLDEQYRAAGAILVDRTELFASSDILLKVRPPIQGQELEQIKNGSTLISFLYPNQNKDIVDALAQKQATAFAMEMIPRISRAQIFDALRYVVLMRHISHRFLQRYIALWLILLDTKPFSRLLIISVVSSLVK